MSHYRIFIYPGMLREGINRGTIKLVPGCEENSRGVGTETAIRALLVKIPKTADLRALVS